MLPQEVVSKASPPAVVPDDCQASATVCYLTCCNVLVTAVERAELDIGTLFMCNAVD